LVRNFCSLDKDKGIETPRTVTIHVVARMEAIVFFHLISFLNNAPDLSGFNGVVKVSISFKTVSVAFAFAFAFKTITGDKVSTSFTIEGIEFELEVRTFVFELGILATDSSSEVDFVFAFNSGLASGLGSGFSSFSVFDSIIIINYTKILSLNYFHVLSY
jgi:hypothetical protein